jgi:hypothetical protein
MRLRQLEKLPTSAARLLLDVCDAKSRSSGQLARCGKRSDHIAIEVLVLRINVLFHQKAVVHPTHGYSNSPSAVTTDTACHLDLHTRHSFHNQHSFHIRRLRPRSILR